MYNIAICEDDKIQADEIIDRLNKYEKSNNAKFNIDYFESGDLLIKDGYEKYHIIFMDVQMSELDGIETAKLIRETNKNVKIFFITGMEKYWSDGYKVAAYRYIIKPVKEADFLNELDELLKEMNSEKNFISITKGSCLIKVMISDIKYMEIMDRKVVIYTFTNVYSSNLSLNYWSELLSNHNFAKPHNSYLVNFKYISFLEKDKLTLLSGEEIYISKRKYKEFKDLFTAFLGRL